MASASMRCGIVLFTVTSTGRFQPSGKPIWHWSVDIASTPPHKWSGTDLAGWHNAEGMLGDFLSFVSEDLGTLQYARRTGTPLDSDLGFSEAMLDALLTHDIDADRLTLLESDLFPEEPTE